MIIVTGIEIVLIVIEAIEIVNGTAITEVEDIIHLQDELGHHQDVKDHRIDGQELLAVGVDAQDRRLIEDHRDLQEEMQTIEEDATARAVAALTHQIK